MISSFSDITYKEMGEPASFYFFAELKVFFLNIRFGLFDFLFSLDINAGEVSVSPFNKLYVSGLFRILMF